MVITVGLLLLLLRSEFGVEGLGLGPEVPELLGTLLGERVGCF